MAIDIRAEVSCSLGTVISGSFADDYLQGNGLIKTRGEVVLNGTQTPVVGTEVTFTYDKGGSTYTIPRVLRVLSSFADPFRRTTTVQLGCKLTYLENRKPPVEDPNAKDEHSDVPCKVFLKAMLPISADYVFQQCLDALELDSASIPLTNKYSVEEFDLSPGFIQVMGDLLQSEGYVGYLDSSETLQFLDLTEDSAAGPVITPAEVVDLGPIGVGDLPGESVVVRFNSLRLLPPDELYGDDFLKRSWEIEEVFGAPSEVSVSYTNDAGTTITDDDVFYPYSFTATRYDVWDRKIESIALNIVSSAETNNRWASDALRTGRAWNVPAGKLVREVIEYEKAAAPANNVNLLSVQLVGGGVTQIKAALSSAAEEHTGLANLCKTDVPEGADVVKSQTTYNYFSELELAGSLNIDTYIDDTGSLEEFDTIAAELDSTVVVEYETDAASGISKTITKRSISRSQTVSGQQDLATRAQDLDTADLTNSIASLLNLARRQVYIGADTSLHTQREYGLQKRPSEADRNNTANEKPTVTEQKAEIAWVTGSTTSTAVTEFTVPYAPDDEITWDESSGALSSVPSDAKEKALRYGRIQNKLLLGNRSGVSLQLAPEQLPKRPFDPLYLQASGITGAYRVNGTSWAFDASGIVASTDALLWGAVSATSGTNLASSWVPLAPGTTSLPLPYTPTSGGLDSETGVTYSAVITPTTVLPPYIESVLLEGVSRSSAAITDYPYTLDRGSTGAVLVSRSSVVIASTIAAELGSFALSGQLAGRRYTRAIKAGVGSFSATGYGAGSIRDYRIGTNAGTFTLNGQNAIVAFQRAPLTAEAGSFVLTGQDAQFIAAISLLAETGAFTLTGQDAGSLRSYIFPAEAGSFTASGQDANLNYVSPLAASLLYTGTAANQSIAGAGFKPGFLIINRADAASSTYVFDQRRGSTSSWNWTASTTQSTVSTSVTSFDSDGFSLGTSATWNGSGLSYVALALKEAEASSTNTNGSITTTVNANDAAGYSIFSFTGNSTSGATVGHGLSAAPELVLFKNHLSVGFEAIIGSSYVGANKRLNGTTGAVAVSDTNCFQAFDASTLTLGTYSGVNNTRQYVAYAFRSTDVVKVGVLEGNGVDTLVTSLGFRPAFIYVKAFVGTTGSHLFYYRQASGDGFADFFTGNSTSDVPGTSGTFSITSTGFTVAANGPGNVASGDQAVYLAVKG